MNRRALLASLPASAFGRPSAAPARVVDVHTHFYDPLRPQGVPWPAKDNAVLYRATLPPRFREIARPHGVTATVVVEASPWVEDNQWLLDLAKDDPFLVGIVGNLDPLSPDFATNLNRFARNPLFRGIRIHARKLQQGVTQAPFVDAMRRMEGLGLELDIGGGPEMFVDVARLNDRVPSLRVVLNHLPFDRRDASIAELHGRAPVYAKVSSLPRKYDGVIRTDLAFFRPALDEIWSVFGADRVVYGSNWPVTDMYAPYGTVKRIVADYFSEKGADAVEKYFWKNSKKAYGWLER